MTVFRGDVALYCMILYPSPRGWGSRYSPQSDRAVCRGNGDRSSTSIEKGVRLGWNGFTSEVGQGW